jgi:hypothetical protein
MRRVSPCRNVVASEQSRSDGRSSPVPFKADRSTWRLSTAISRRRAGGRFNLVGRLRAQEDQGKAKDRAKSEIHGESASTACSSSDGVTSKTCSASASIITTGTVRTGPSASRHRPPAILAPTCEPVGAHLRRTDVLAASSTNTAWLYDLGGRVFGRHRLEGSDTSTSLFGLRVRAILPGARVIP